MTSELALGWVLVVALSLCVAVGLGIALVSMRAGWTAGIRAAVIFYGFLALVFMLSPKWTTFTIEGMGIKAQMAKLEREVEDLRRENSSYERTIAELRQREGSSLVASAFLNKLQEAGAHFETGSIDESDGIKLAVESHDFDISLQGVAKQLQATPENVFETFKNAGFHDPQADGTIRS
jgi:hypothetical protein